MTKINVNTVQLVNKGHRREGHHMVFADKWPLFGGNIVLSNRGREDYWCGLYLQGSPYSDVAFNAGKTVVLLYVKV